MATDSESGQAGAADPVRRKFLTLEVLALCGTHLSAVVYPLLGLPISTRVYLNPFAVVEGLVEMSRLGLYLFVMYASGDPMPKFGLRAIRWRTDLIALFVAVLGSTFLYGWRFLPTYHSARLPSGLADKVVPLWLLAALCLLVGLFEEIAFRGYLIPRLEELAGSTAIAVIGQAAFFGLVHLYEGLIGVISGALFGLFMGIVFVKWRSVWPLAVTHGLVDFVLIYQVIR